MYIEQQGSVSLKVVAGDYLVEAGDREVFLTRPSGRPFATSTDYSFTHAERNPAGNGYVAVMRFADGQVSLRRFDADGALIQWSDKAAPASYRDQEGALNLDIDGDGTITPDERYVEQEGALALKLNNGVYQVEAAGGDVTLTRPSGRAFESSTDYSFIHAEPDPAGNGYVAVMRFADGQVSLRRFDADGALIQWSDKAAPASYRDQEGALNLDIDADGTITPAEHYVEQEGALALKLNNGVYQVEAAGGDVTLTRPSGRAFESSTDYSFTHAEPAPAGNGYVAVMRFADGQVSLRRFDADGALIQWSDKAAPASYRDQEGALNLDIDGDGTITPDERYVEQEGALALKLNNGVYQVEAAGGDVTLTRPSGRAFESSIDYSFIHAEPDPAGNGYVAVMRFADGQVSLRWFSADGTLTNWSARADADSYLDQEEALNLDINGDGVITPASQYVEQDGSLPLKVAANGVYQVETAAGDVTLTRPKGAPYKESDTYSFTHAEPDPQGNGYVAVMRFSDDSVSLRRFDADGTLTNWSAQADADSYLGQEEALNLDINEDGVIGPPSNVTVTMPLQVDNWQSGNNDISLTLTFSSAIEFDGVSLEGGGATSSSISSTTQGGMTIMEISLSAVNGRQSGVFNFDFVTLNTQLDRFEIKLEGLESNDSLYPDYTYISVDGKVLNANSIFNNDHGDSQANATPIVLGGVTEGRIDIAGDKDVFSFAAVEGQRYMVSMDALDLETARFSVKDSQEIFSVASAYDRDLAEISFVAENTSTHYITAHELGDDAIGDYTISVNSVSVPDDHGDSPANATLAGLGDVTEGRIDIAGDKDVFSFAAVEGQRYMVSMDALDLETARFSVKDSQEIFSVASADDRDLAEISFVAENTSTHYITAHELGDDAIGDYTISVNNVSVPDDHGDSPANATLVGLGDVTEGRIDIAGDKDVFSFAAVEGQRYMVSMDALDLETARFSVKDSQEIFSVASAYDHDLAEISFVAENTSTHYITAHELGDDEVGDYTVSVREEIVSIPHVYSDRKLNARSSWQDDYEVAAMTKNEKYDAAGGGEEAVELDVESIDEGYDVQLMGVKQDDLAIA